MQGKPMTAREAACAKGFRERNSSAPRLTEMCNARIVEIVGKVTGSVTNRPVSIYRGAYGTEFTA